MVVCLKEIALPVLVSEDHKTETAATATASTTAKADTIWFESTLQRLKKTLEMLQRNSSTEALPEKKTKVQQTTGSVIKPASEIDLQRTREAQRLLNLLGYNAGTVDGRPGPQTSRAVRDFQRDNRLRIDGNISDTLISQLRKVNGEKRSVKAKPAAFLVPSPDLAQMNETPPKSDIEIFYDMVQRERAEKLLRPKEKPVLPERFDHSGHGNGGGGNGSGSSGGNSGGSSSGNNGGQCSSEGGPSGHPSGDCGPGGPGPDPDSSCGSGSPSRP
jgi:peptidoglycan hydrolase-like protein with peptidoglycan-binding domain